MITAQLIRNKFYEIRNNERSNKLFVNIVGSLLVKVISTLVTLSIIPISLKFLDIETYGVWLTISSVITWLYIFDFGLTTGLSNRLSEAFASKNTELARKYLSTTYFILAVFIIIALLLYAGIRSFVNWNSVFNTNLNNNVLLSILDVTFFSFCLLFLLKPVTSLLMSRQKHFLSSLILVIGNVVSLISIYFFCSLSSTPIIFIAVAFSLAYPLILLFYSIICYSTHYKNLAPCFRFVDLSIKKYLFGLSIKFFIIQISVIAILTSTSFLISSFVDHLHVTYYNIAYRLFSLVSIFQLMFLNPLWNAFTEAYFQRDFKWIRSAIRKMEVLNFFLCFILLVLFGLHEYIYQVWIGEDTIIPYSLNVMVAIYMLFVVLAQPYVHFINGTGKLNMQMTFSIITIVCHVPLAYFLAKTMKMGVNGILFLNLMWSIFALLLFRYQYKMIISERRLNKFWS